MFCFNAYDLEQFSKKQIKSRRKKLIFYKVITMQQHLNENTNYINKNEKMILVIMEIRETLP